MNHCLRAPVPALFAARNNPVRCTPGNRVRLAKKAGMKYIVPTPKHHDGFANFAAKTNRWNIVPAAPYDKTF